MKDDLKITILEIISLLGFFINNLKIIKYNRISQNNLLLLKSYDEESTNEVSDILNENRMEDQVHQYKEKY